MTTLVSKDQKKTITLNKAKGFKLDDGGMLILSYVNEINEAAEWMCNHGVSGVYFNPEGETYDYKDFRVVSEQHNGIILYN